VSSGPHLFQAIASGAADATDAAGAAVVGARGDEVEVVAVAGSAPGRSAGDPVAPGDDSLGFVLASGQTLSLGPRDGSVAVLCVPCLGAEGVLGALELRAGPGVDSFSPEASRLAALFAEIATAALVAGGLEVDTGPSPAELAAELARLQDADPSRYAAIASAVSALLAHG
jgi:hypothetical protein